MSRKKYPLYQQLSVVDTATKGQSIAKTDEGQVVLISGGVPGDVVDVQVYKKRKRLLHGNITHFHKRSDKRIKPLCVHFDNCGGCKWQHMDYPHQLVYKQQEVTNNLRKIGDFEVPQPLPIVGAKEIFYYRNKMEFSFSNNRWLSKEEMESDEIFEDRNALGFHIAGMWDKILDLTECHLQADPSNEIRMSLKKFAQEHKLSFYDVRQHTGLLRTLMIRLSTTGDLMVLLQFGEKNDAQQKLVLDFLAQKFPQISALLYVVNTKQNDTLYDQEIICHKGLDHITEEMEGLQFKIRAKSFYQTNSKQAHQLYLIVRDFANLQQEDIVYDLYTGTGTIAQFVSSQCKKIIGIESVDDAIKDAKQNALDNGISNTEFFVGDMKNVFNTDFVNTHGTPRVIITDPPRDGMHRDVVQQILNIAPERIVYVSCNSATQARDIDLMSSHYKISKSQAVDMFPQTHHIENVVLLERL